MPVVSFVLLYSIAAVFGAPCERTDASLPLRVIRQVAMAAEFEILLYAARPDADPESLRDAAQAAFAAVDALEARISRWQPDSIISRINRNAAEHPVQTPADIFQLLQHSSSFYESTGGVFDVTVGPLLELWGFYGKKGAYPDAAALKQTMGKIGLSHVRLDADAQTVFFERPGMTLDFGGIGKGLALDYAATVLQEQGIAVARLQGGTSTIVALGAPPGKPGWTVDIRSPYNNENAPIATIDICNESLSTSSLSERYVEIEGKRYGHIIDPRTGMPASGVASATAIAPTGMESDALSTAFLIMGPEAVRAYCREHPHVRALLAVESDGAFETIYINFGNVLKKEQS